MSKKLLTSESDFQIRYTTAFDAGSLKKWLLIPGVLHWFYVKSRVEIEDHVKMWISFHRYKCSLTAFYQGAACGIATLFLMPYQKVAHQAQGFIIVDPLFHRKGVGRSLIKNLNHLAKTYFSLEKLHYEVYGDNPLLELLRQEGFHEVFKQEGFIKDTDHKYLKRTVMEIDFRERA